MNNQISSLSDIAELDDPLNILGCGSMTIIKKVTQKKEPLKYYAIKLIDKKNNIDTNNFYSVANLHKKLIHPNIIKYITSFEDNNY